MANPLDGYITKVDFTHTPTLSKFLKSTADIKIVVGCVGSGKTHALAIDIMQKAHNQEPSPRDGVRYTRMMIVRNTYHELKTTLLPIWKKLFPPDHCGRINESPPIKQHIIIPGELDCEILFVALDRPGDVKRIKSINLSHIWLMETREFYDFEIFENAWDRVGRYPDPNDDSHGVECTHPSMIGDTNPPDDDHWLVALEKFGLGDAEVGSKGASPVRIEFFHQPPAVIDVTDSPGGPETVIYAPFAERSYMVNPEAENLPNLSKDYYAKKLAVADANHIRVYYEGKYGVTGGGRPVIPQYDDVKMSVENLSVLSNMPLLIGADIGGGTLSPAVVIGQVHPLGTILIHAEITGTDMGLVRCADKILSVLAEKFPGKLIERGYGDPAGAKMDELYEGVIFDHFKNRGIPMKSAGTNDIQSRIEAGRAPMIKNINSRPGLLINKECKVLRAALSGKWHFRRVQSPGTVKFTDKPDKGQWSHVADAYCYLCLGTGGFQELHGRKRRLKTMTPGRMKTGRWDVFK